jgi:Domain of unknown function (DUF4440)
MRTILFVALTVVTLNACAAQTPTGNADKQTILSLGRELREAPLSGKCEVFERILANDYSGTGSDGTVRNKAQTIDSCKTFAALPESIRPRPDVATHDCDIRIYQNVAVETGNSTAEQQFATLSDWENKRAPIKVVDEVRYTTVWVKTDDRWQLASAQTTKIAPPERK